MPARICMHSDPSRLFVTGMQLDERSVYSLLQFGAIIPPLSQWKGVSRFTPGMRSIVRIDDLHIDEQPLHDRWTNAEGSDATMCDDEQVACINAMVDDLLREACPQRNPVILFSGGVDSGLLAARAASMGWRDTLLLHYSMAKDDPETTNAQAVAKRLGLTIECVRDSEVDGFGMLDAVAETWSQPFGDTSTLPTHALSKAVIARLAGGSSRVVIDGTGADGCFGLFGRAASWRKVERVPGRLRRLAAAAYASTRMWRSTSAIERRLRLLRRSSQMPMLPASVAQNPLLGIAYHASEQSRQFVIGTLERWIRDSVPSKDDRATLAGVDLALVCADIFAQKNHSIFDGSPHRIVYPFLDQRMVSLALQRAIHWPGGGEPKRALKLALARQIPANLVHRPKSGFVAPLREKYRDARFLQALDHLCDPGAALASWINQNWFKRIRSDLAEGRPLPAQTYSFVWNAVFAEFWLEQAPSVMAHFGATAS